MGIHKPYAYHKPSEEGLLKITLLREHFSKGDDLIRSSSLPSREQAIAITQNEIAAMCAIKSVVFNDPDSEVG